MCRSLFFDKVASLRPETLLKRETLVQVFYCEFCRNYKNTLFTEYLHKTASEPLTNFAKKAAL